MKRIVCKLNRRKFMKTGVAVLASPLLMKLSGMVSTARAKASDVSDAYNRAINRMIEGFRKKASTMTGLGKGSGSGTTTAEQLIASAHVTENRFWTDEGYATGTRWGGLIAYPMFESPSSGAKNILAPHEWETSDTGYCRQLWPGQDWEFYQPIRVGDTLRVWNREPKLIEQKTPDRSGIRGFLNLEGDYDVINQRDEIVTTIQNYTVRIFFPDGPPGPPYTLERYGFTEEEIFYLDRLARAEKVRGEEIRYWEDVNVGDMLDPVVIAPTNMNNIGDHGSTGMPKGVANQGGMGAMAAGPRGPKGNGEGRYPINKLLEKEGVIGEKEYVKGATGLYYRGGGNKMRHWDDINARAQGEPGAFLWGEISIRCMLCAITNWMGDDAFVRKYSWRNVTRSLVGDASYALGKVTGKRMDNGEHLVDIFVWQRDLRGFIVDASVATVALRSKDENYPDFKKVIKY